MQRAALAGGNDRLLQRDYAHARARCSDAGERSSGQACWVSHRGAFVRTGSMRPLKSLITIPGGGNLAGLAGVAGYASWPRGRVMPSDMQGGKVGPRLQKSLLIGETSMRCSEDVVRKGMAHLMLEDVDAADCVG